MMVITLSDSNDDNNDNDDGIDILMMLMIIRIDIDWSHYADAYDNVS